MSRSICHSCIALLVACNYLAFRAELFDKEYEENHHLPYASCSISGSGITWETFDKDNAPKAIIYDFGLRISCLLVLEPHRVETTVNTVPDKLVRDKSPPSLPS